MTQWIRSEQHPPEDKRVLLTDGIDIEFGKWAWGLIRDHEDPDFCEYGFRYWCEGLLQGSVTYWAEVELPPERIDAEDELAARYYCGEIDNLGNSL
jgi:hypothetical protein